MILINGKESKFQTQEFTNLEQMLLASFEDCTEAHQIITDVRLNDEIFSEIYPHQAEDISAAQVNKLEITSVPINSMALDIIEELFKVTKSLSLAAVQTSEHFRKGDDAKALEILQNLIDVNRDFLNVFGTLRTSFDVPQDEYIDKVAEKYSDLLSEVIDVMEAEDWILLADLLEFEITPAYLEWDSCLNSIKLHYTSMHEEDEREKAIKQ